MKSNSIRNLFEFERGEFSDLNWMPLTLRYRLDVSGLKLSLAIWQRIPISERMVLLDLPFESEMERETWVSRLKSAVSDAGDVELPKVERWVDAMGVPPDLRTRLTEMGIGMAAAGWNRLSPLQRYALCKLAQSKQGDRLFPHAAKEFGLHPRPM